MKSQFIPTHTQNTAPVSESKAPTDEPDDNKIPEEPTEKLVRSVDFTTIRLKNAEGEGIRGKDGHFLRYDKIKKTKELKKRNEENYTEEGNERFDELEKEMAELNL